MGNSKKADGAPEAHKTREETCLQEKADLLPATESIYHGRVVNLSLEEVRLPNGVTTKLEVIRHPGAAAVVAVDQDGLVLLLRQYRHATGGMLWEVPAGTVIKGEKPADCAYRELREEAGVDAGRLVPMGAIFTCPGFCDEKIHLFLATDLRPAQRSLDIDEVIEEVVRVSMEKALEMIDESTIVDAKSIAAIYLASRRLQLLRYP